MLVNNLQLANYINWERKENVLPANCEESLGKNLRMASGCLEWPMWLALILSSLEIISKHQKLSVTNIKKIKKSIISHPCMHEKNKWSNTTRNRGQSQFVHNLHMNSNIWERDSIQNENNPLSKTS